MARCEYATFLEKGPAFSWTSQGWKTDTVWLPHHGHCAPAGRAAQRRVPPGWLCTLPVGPGAAAGRAQPRPCRPRPSGPPPSSAPAPAADASVCCRLRTTPKGKVRPKCHHTWTLDHQNVGCVDAHTVLVIQLELFRWVQGSFSAPLWVCLSLHKPNAALFGDLWRCSKQKTDDEDATTQWNKE